MATAMVGASVVLGVLFVSADAAAAATINVPCGNTAALVTEINNANSTPAHDTIEITGAPCTFSISSPASVAANNNNTGLPIVTAPLTINGHGATIERGTGATQPFRILFANGAATTLTLNELTITRGLLNGGNVGAGVVTFGGASLVLDRVTVSGNSTSGTNANGVAASGAGIATFGGALTIDHSTIASNIAPVSAGMALTATTATVRRSALFANVASSSTGVSWIQGGVVTLENTSVYSNTSGNSIGGITVSNFGANPGTLNVVSSTFADNGALTGTAPGAALFRFPNGANPGPVAINVTDTIITDTDSTAAATLAPCTGVTNGGGNIEWPGASCGFGNTANPRLAPVALNGGTTNNFRPLPDSPVIDLGGATCPQTDQRDVARPDGDGCDTGSHETPAADTAAEGPTGTTNNPQVTFNSPDTPSATFECKVDTGLFVGCTSPFSPNVGTGTHTVQVRAIHPNGGYLDKSPASVTFTVDKAAPVVTITGAPASPSPDDTPTFTFTVDDPNAAVTCQVDTDTPVSCTSPYTTPPLAHGSHTITISATDSAGNVGSAQRTIAVDTAPAQTFDVPCGDVTALRSAITAANATFAPDTINVTGGPCTFTLTNSVDPAAGGTGLPLVVHPLTVEGHGATIERSAAAGTASFRIWFAVGSSDPATTLTLRDMTIQRGSLTNNAGAGVAAFVAGLRLDGVTIQQNTASGTGANGGGVAILGGSLEVDHSSFFLNQAATGAALATTQTPGVVRRSTFFLNGGAATASGATAWVQGETVTFENVTIAGNAANNGIGGIVASNSGAVSGTVNVVSSTLFNQRRTNVNAPAAHLFTFHQQGTGTETIHVTDTIITDSSTATPVLAACTGTVVDDGGNLEWPGTSCGFDTNADPQLDPAIALYGGKTLNYRLLPTSPAIDLGGASCPAVDQRDVPRPDGDGCDAGSHETPAPETVATGPSTPTDDPEITFSSPDTPTATFECQLDGAAFLACTSPYAPSVDDGEHSVNVRAIASGGYRDPSPATVTFTVDTTAPVVEIIAAPTSPTNDSTPTIEFTSDDPTATYECRINSDVRAACSSPYTTPSLPEGIHTITVYGTDQVGNEGSDSVTIAISFGPPDTVIDSGPSGTHYYETATFAFHSTKPNSTFECRLDSAPFAPCTSPHTVRNYAPGAHTFAVRAIDVAGVADPTPATRSFAFQRCTIIRLIVNLRGTLVPICI